jgi:curved DNA-binding protein CbpA
MAETFYSTLGVDADADAETIHRAYREHVKESHPDVSDDPDAPERFKRLTAARETLTDTDERARYDRLGHDAYVRQHGSPDLWETAAGSGTRSATAQPSPEAKTQTSSDGGYDRTAWLGNDGGPTKTERTATSTYRKRRRKRRDKRTSSTATSDEDWQYASEAYRNADTNFGTREQSRGRAVVGVLGDVGPWLVIHVVFILSAIATAWITFVQIEQSLRLSVPVILLGGAVLAMVVFVSVMHVISQLYA